MRQYKYVLAVPSEKRTVFELLVVQECYGKILDLALLGGGGVYTLSFPKAALRQKFLRIWRVIINEDKKKAVLDFLLGKGPKPSVQDSSLPAVPAPKTQPRVHRSKGKKSLQG
jgi:hypothetical protein